MQKILTQDDWENFLNNAENKSELVKIITDYYKSKLIWKKLKSPLVVTDEQKNSKITNSLVNEDLSGNQLKLTLDWYINIKIKTPWRYSSIWYRFTCLIQLYFYLCVTYFCYVIHFFWSGFWLLKLENYLTSQVAKEVPNKLKSFLRLLKINHA